MGYFFLFGFAALSGLGLHLMQLAALKVGPTSSFYTVADATIPKWAFLVDVAVAIKCFGVAIAYMIVIGDLMPQAY